MPPVYHRVWLYLFSIQGQCNAEELTHAVTAWTTSSSSLSRHENPVRSVCVWLCVFVFGVCRCLCGHACSCVCCFLLWTYFVGDIAKLGEDVDVCLHCPDHLSLCRWIPSASGSTRFVRAGVRLSRSDFVVAYFGFSVLFWTAVVLVGDQIRKLL